MYFLFFFVLFCVLLVVAFFSSSGYACSVFSQPWKAEGNGVTREQLGNKKRNEAIENGNGNGNGENGEIQGFRGGGRMWGMEDVVSWVR